MGNPGLTLALRCTYIHSSIRTVIAMSSTSSQPARRTDKIGNPLRRAFRTTEPDHELPEAFQSLLGRMRANAAADDRVAPERLSAGASRRQ